MSKENPSTLNYEYIRDKNNHRKGILVAAVLEDNKTFSVNFSMCRKPKKFEALLPWNGNNRIAALTAVPPEPKKVLLGGDTFNKERGMTIATKRAGGNKKHKIPHSITQQFIKFRDRQTKFFHDKKYVETANASV